MSICTIAFCLANLYVNVEVAGPQKAFAMEHVHEEGAWCENHYCKGNPVTLKIGMPIALGRDDMLIYYGLKHTSFLQEKHDTGQNTWFISITWMPFR